MSYCYALNHIVNLHFPQLVAKPLTEQEPVEHSPYDDSEAEEGRDESSPTPPPEAYPLQ